MKLVCERAFSYVKRIGKDPLIPLIGVFNKKIIPEKHLLGIIYQS